MTDFKFVVVVSAQGERYSATASADESTERVAQRLADVRGWKLTDCEIEEHPSPSPPRSGLLPPNTSDLLFQLHAEFYGGDRAHADAFRILPRVIQALEAKGAVLQRVEEFLSGCVADGANHPLHSEAKSVLAELGPIVPIHTKS